MDREAVDEIKRYFSVVIEVQDTKIQLLAEGLGARLDSLDTKVDSLETKVDRLDIKVDRLEARVGGLEARVGGVEGEVRGLTQVVQLLYTEVTGRLKDHETRIGGLEPRLP
jgi:chaperonin cofactor prefoldin